jgi:hypothetical protein
MTTPLVSQSYASNGRPYWLSAGEPTFSKITAGEIDIPADADGNEFVLSGGIPEGTMTIAYLPAGGQATTIAGFQSNGVVTFAEGIAVGAIGGGDYSTSINANGVIVDGSVDINGAVDIVGNVSVSQNLSVGGALSAAGGISGMVPSQTAFLQSGTYQLNQPISSGTYLEPFDPTGSSAFYVPRTGVYALSANIGFNVDAVNGASFGPSDYFSVVVCPLGGAPTALIDVIMKPWNMPSTSATPYGQDFGQSGMALGVLQAGVPYQFAVWVDNFSGTTACPAGVAAGANLIALC